MVKHRGEHPEAVDGCYACKISGIRWNGMVSLKSMREEGTTGAAMAKENRENFIRDKGYEPYSASERWI